MQKYYLITFLAIQAIFLFPSPGDGIANDQGRGKVIMGYVTQWQKIPLTAIAFKHLTHVLYAFVFIKPNGNLRFAENTINYFQQLKEIKNQYPHLKVLISIGGERNSNEFRYLKTESAKIIFAQDCVKILKQYNFDGIDIDWEYPSTNEINDYAELLRIMDQQLGQYLLTSAVPAGIQNTNGFNANAMNKYLDLILVMTYDYAGSWNRESTHNSPLYGNGDYNCRGAIEAWKRKSLDVRKMVLGIPFFGVKFRLNQVSQNKPGSPVTFIDKITVDQIQNINLIKEWDSMSHNSYGYHSSYWYSFEDEKSITSKINYVNQNDLAGVMIWELSQNKDQSLLSFIYNALRQGVPYTLASAHYYNMANDSYNGLSNNETALEIMTLPKLTSKNYPASFNRNDKCISEPALICNYFGKEHQQAYPLDCSKYVDCRDVGMPVLNCPPGLHWNQPILSCDWPDNVKCIPCM